MERKKSLGKLPVLLCEFKAWKKTVVTVTIFFIVKHLLKKMPTPVKNVLDEAIKIINFVKYQPLSTRVFTIFREGMKAIHKALFNHTEVRWRSHWKTLVQLFELRNELFVIFIDYSFNLKPRLIDKMWLFRCIVGQTFS